MSEILTLEERLNRIRIVMVNTTLPANIGAAARAMKTMGLSRLVLVAPKTFPSGDATALASGAASILEQAIVVDTLEDAIADCHVVFGTSARSRTIPWPLLEARAATGLAIQQADQHEIAIVFGREDRGLTNDELAQCNYHLTIPVNSEYGVLNVAAAIQVICYELRMHALETQSKQQHSNPAQSALMPLPNQQAMQWDEPLVTQSQMQQFFPHLEAMLTDIDFLDPQNPRLLPLRLRRLFGRIQLDRMEYNLLRGIFGRVQALSRGNWPLKNTSQHNPDQSQNTENTLLSVTQDDNDHV
ncbi:RNA methyltransferase [Alkanindiges illinoisensis]|uniref:RNA methyltransferase n=1 Tax=Alkanindiges illinoisensis TaxID=197183 RepID=UPI000A71698A|nr:RNA methyltransferase [Alkanindiges illinoisensis]